MKLPYPIVTPPRKGYSILNRKRRRKSKVAICIAATALRLVRSWLITLIAAFAVVLSSQYLVLPLHEDPWFGIIGFAIIVLAFELYRSTPNFSK